MAQQEKKVPFLVPNGYKEIDVLRKIADSMLDIEINKKWLRGKSGKMSSAALPPETSNDVEEGMREFDEFFRNLAREAGKRPT